MRWLSSACPQLIVSRTCYCGILLFMMCLAYHNSHETLIHQQSSVRGLLRFVARLTATRDASCPQGHRQLFEDTCMVMSYDMSFSFRINKVMYLRIHSWKFKFRGLILHMRIIAMARHNRKTTAAHTIDSFKLLQFQSSNHSLQGLTDALLWTWQAWLKIWKILLKLPSFAILKLQV